MNNYDVIKKPMEVRRSIGFLTNELKLDAHFTPRYTMAFFGQLHNLSKREIEIQTNDLFSYFDIHTFADKRISDLSTGMKQKLSIAVSLIHNPDIIIFDEPTNGLDIITARSVTEYIKVLKSQGKLVVISTHIMSVASKLCDKIAIIIEGKIVAEGTIPSILQQTRTHDLEEAFFYLYHQTVKEVL